MRFAFEDDPSLYADRVRPFLEEHIESNVLATVLVGVLDGRYPDAAPVLAYAIDDRDEVAGAALRTPPWPMLCSELDPPAAQQLIDAWLAIDAELPGVHSLSQTARAVASAWRRRTGGSSRCRTSMALHALTTVIEPPRPAPGCLCQATPRQYDLLVAWWKAFAVEAGVIGAGADAGTAVQARLEQHDVWLWEDLGRAPVSMVATNPAIAGVVRVGPVYTPPCIGNTATPAPRSPPSANRHSKEARTRVRCTQTWPTRRRTRSTPMSATKASRLGRNTSSGPAKPETGHRNPHSRRTASSARSTARQRGSLAPCELPQ